MRHYPKTTPPSSTASLEDRKLSGILPRTFAVEPVSLPWPGESSPQGLDEWSLVHQVWRDWRTAIMGRYDGDARELLEQVWAAGLVDGAATISGSSGNGHGSTARRMVLEVTQSHGDQGRINLMRFQKAIGGIGEISGPYPQVFPSPYYYVWRASSEEEVHQVWKVVGPFLGLSMFVQFRQLFAATARGRRAVNGATGARKRTEAPNGKSGSKGKRVQRKAD